ncbi:hypothetical protein B0H10DRAFT_2186299 [Mycena sp. CBHHK59/15]|nr:hypothetical protein B0H10DRAFT_2186299 [Mycena sp. CBHHK59/15]
MSLGIDTGQERAQISKTSRSKSGEKTGRETKDMAAQNKCDVMLLMPTQARPKHGTEFSVGAQDQESPPRSRSQGAASQVIGPSSVSRDIAEKPGVQTKCEQPADLSEMGILCKVNYGCSCHSTNLSGLYKPTIRSSQDSLVHITVETPAKGSITMLRIAKAQTQADVLHIAETFLAASIVLEEDPVETDLLGYDEEEAQLLHDDITETLDLSALNWIAIAEN